MSMRNVLSRTSELAKVAEDYFGGLSGYDGTGGGVGKDLEKSQKDVDSASKALDNIARSPKPASKSNLKKVHPISVTRTKGPSPVDKLRNLWK